MTFSLKSAQLSDLKTDSEIIFLVFIVYTELSLVNYGSVLKESSFSYESQFA